MRPPLMLVVGSAVVLLGAYLASRLLVSDVPAPAPQVEVLTVVGPPSDGLRPATLAPPAAHPTANLQAAQEAMAGPRPGPLVPVNKPPAFPHPVDNPPPPVEEVAPSPFQGDSKELDYAEAIMNEPEVPNERLQSAHDVLARCVEQEPDNQRCQAGLAQVNARLFPRATTEVKPRAPTLVVQPPNQVRPTSQPR